MASINLKRKLPKIEKEGFQAIKENIERLFAILKPYQEKKMIIDNKVNQLIALHGKEKEIFRYQGVEAYDFITHSVNDAASCQDYYRVKLSDVHYFNKIPRDVDVYQPNEQLYVIDGKFLFKKITMHSEYKKLSKFIGDRPDHYFQLIGGMLNTPILIFYIRNYFDIKGDIYYVDCFKNRLTRKLSDAKGMARDYVGNDFVLDVFHKCYQVM